VVPAALFPGGVLSVPLAVLLAEPVNRAVEPTLPVAVTSAEAGFKIWVLAAASALNGAGVRTLEYPGNNCHVNAVSLKSIKVFSGKFDRGSAPGTPLERLRGFHVLLPY
jgi:hypothetical protein